MRSAGNKDSGELWCATFSAALLAPITSDPIAFCAGICALSGIMPFTRIGVNLEPRTRRRHFPFFTVLVESGN